MLQDTEHYLPYSCKFVLHCTHNTDKQNTPEVKLRNKKKQLVVESCTMVVFKKMHLNFHITEMCHQ